MRTARSLQHGGSLSGGVSVWGVPGQGGLRPGMSLSRGVSSQGGLPDKRPPPPLPVFVADSKYGFYLHMYEKNCV